MEGWYQVALLSVGGSLGVNARYWLGVAITRWAGPQFPWATLAINVSGSFAIGLLTVLLSRWLPHPHMRLLLVVGFLGGYTTFSSFSAEALVLWERGERRASLGYVAGSVGAGLVAVVLRHGGRARADRDVGAVVDRAETCRDRRGARRGIGGPADPDRAGGSEAPP